MKITVRGLFLGAAALAMSGCNFGFGVDRDALLAMYTGRSTSAQPAAATPLAATAPVIPAAAHSPAPAPAPVTSPSPSPSAAPALTTAAASLPSAAHPEERRPERRKEHPKEEQRDLRLGLKYVAFSPSDDEEARVQGNLEKVNSIWKDCEIQFQMDRFEGLRSSDLADLDLREQTRDYGELSEIRHIFRTDDSLLVVQTGAWDRSGTIGRTAANAWTTLPGEGLYGAILEKPVSEFAPILAHELGHYLSLGHSEDPRSLMSPLVSEHSERLSAEECAEARWAARQFWKKMIR